EAASSQYMNLAPLEPGRICLAGHMGRTWLAIATFEGDKKSIRVFHTAREAQNPEDKAQARSTAVSFMPDYMFTLESARSTGLVRRTLIGRFAWNSQAGKT